MYFYQPSQGHGLPHDPLNAIIGPRPIGWISSCDKAGQLNLAPYSFFNCFNYRPPIIGFSSNGWKDSVRNITKPGVCLEPGNARSRAGDESNLCDASPRSG
jgi:flavin reductase (DIM6/NTAB) family NADH-FMN oxidoreductase RutF